MRNARGAEKICCLDWGFTFSTCVIDWSANLCRNDTVLLFLRVVLTTYGPVEGKRGGSGGRKVFQQQI